MQHNEAKCCILFNFMLTFTMLSVVMLNVVMLSVVMLNVVMLSVVAPCKTFLLGQYLLARSKPTLEVLYSMGYIITMCA